MPLKKESKPNQTTYLGNTLAASNLINHKKGLINKCIWTTLSCLKKMKKYWRLIQTIRITNLERGMEFGIKNMLCPWEVEKQIAERKWNAKSIKNQKALRNGKLQVLGNIRRWHHQTNGDEVKKSISDEQENFAKQKLYQEPNQKDKHRGSPHCKILFKWIPEFFFNGPGNKKAHDDAQHLFSVKF